jgi:major membrane immunogen (membrane-anchored lipoprotein)
LLIGNQMTKPIITVFLISLLTGCFGVSDSVRESNLTSNIRTNGYYYVTESLDNGKQKQLTVIRFIKGKKKKLKYDSKISTLKGKVLDHEKFDAAYRISCKEERCEVGFTHYINKMSLSYAVDIDGKGNLFLPNRNGNQYFKFKKSK